MFKNLVVQDNDFMNPLIGLPITNIKGKEIEGSPDYGFILFLCYFCILGPNRKKIKKDFKRDFGPIQKYKQRKRKSLSVQSYSLFLSLTHHRQFL
jgi:hypothetical protein